MSAFPTQPRYRRVAALTVSYVIATAVLIAIRGERGLPVAAAIGAQLLLHGHGWNLAVEAGRTGQLSLEQYFSLASRLRLRIAVRSFPGFLMLLFGGAELFAGYAIGLLLLSAGFAIHVVVWVRIPRWCEALLADDDK